MATQTPLSLGVNTLYYGPSQLVTRAKFDVALHVLIINSFAASTLPAQVTDGPLLTALTLPQFHLPRDLNWLILPEWGNIKAWKRNELHKLQMIDD